MNPKSRIKMKKALNFRVDIGVWQGKNRIKLKV
jgi:hypothetical protein